MTSPLVILKVAGGGKDCNRLKITWEYEGVGERYVYAIDKNGIESAGAVARRELASLVSVLMSEKKDSSAVGNALAALADAGTDLYNCLFAGSGKDDEIAQERRQWLEELSAGCDSAHQLEIRVVVGLAIYIPWGLVFHPALGKDLRGSTDFSAYVDFWNHKHSLATVYDMIKPCSSVDHTLPADSTAFLAAHSHSVRSRIDEADKSALKEWPWRNEALTSADFFRALKDSDNLNQIIYFYCHANGEKLSLAENGDYIDVDRLNIKISGRNRNRYALFLLNGCSTAAGHQNRGWLRATSQYGAQGFVGTEVKVPDVFAWRYGIDFLRLFLGGKGTVGEILRVLRVKHWPLSLLYGAYCFPHWRVTGSLHSPELVVKDYSNLSDSLLGSGVME